MKSVARILMVLFISFLSTPTVVTLIEKNTDVSLFYSFSEEEIHKEIKADIKQIFDYPFLKSKIIKKSKIVSENISHHDNVAEEIFSPPPELV